MQTGTVRHPISGQLDSNFDYTNTITIPSEGKWTVGLNVVSGHSSINGTIAAGDWIAVLFCNQLVGKAEFSGSGRYGIAFTDTNSNPDGTALMTFAKSGSTTLSGKLLEGGNFSASSTFSPLAGNAEWPFYALLQNNKGCFLGWMYLDGEGFDEITGVSGNFTLIRPAGGGTYLVSQIAVSGQPAR